VKPRQAEVPDPKPKRFLLYGALILGLVTGLMAEPACRCTWLQFIAAKASGVIVGLAFWSFVLIVGYHGYYFFKSLFHHPP
jgi:hypothetical protein